MVRKANILKHRSTREEDKRPDTELVFLGTSAAIQVPSFHCRCETCEDARANAKHRRTRASAALVGQEIVLIDASPDLEFQLEREAIRRIDRVFITHWHFDHVWGLAALREPSILDSWPPIEVYLPSQTVFHFDEELEYMKNRVKLNPVKPGDRFELKDARWEVVKTTHTDHSVGFIVEASRRFAYLGDGIVPPPETMQRLKNLDFVVLESTVDELLPKTGQKWFNFSLEQALELWRRIRTRECVLTHMSCHSYKAGKLIAGLSHSQRLRYEERNPGLKFAYDGLRLRV